MLKPLMQNMKAAGWGKEDIIDMLCDMGADVHAKNKGGSTPFLCAAFEGQLECMKKLLEKGADIDEVDNDGFSALHLAADQGHLEVIKWLVQKGADLHQKTIDGGSVLWVAAGAGQEEVFEYFLTYCRMSIRQCANGGNTILHQAAYGNNRQIVKICLKSGIDINTKTDDGLTPYDLTESEEIREYLISRGAKA